LSLRSLMCGKRSIIIPWEVPQHLGLWLHVEATLLFSVHFLLLAFMTLHVIMLFANY